MPIGLGMLGAGGEQGGDPVAKVICSLKGAKLGTAAAAELFYLNQSFFIESFGLLILWQCYMSLRLRGEQRS